MSERILFFKISASIYLLEFLQNELSISKEDANFLIQIGAIYHSSSSHNSINHNLKRQTENILLQTGDILRCHKEPRRFPVHFDWQKHILFENNDFVIVDKPAGIPCQASLDNALENLHYQLSLHLKQKLFITHRLDMGTQGLILYAKIPLFQKNFNELLTHRNVEKIYHAITSGPLLPCGLLSHWMLNHPRAPKQLSSSSIPHGKLCELSILEAQSYPNSDFPTGFPRYSPNQYSSNQAFSNLSPISMNYYRLQLHTGRTHQIRAQLAFEKNPIWGDSLYGGAPWASASMEKSQEKTQEFTPPDSFALQCSKLSFNYLGKTFLFEIKPLSVPQ